MSGSSSLVFRVQIRVVFTGCTILTCLAAILLASSTVAPPGGECESRFMQGLFQCFQDHQVPFNSFLWAVGNHTGGLAPRDEAAFREQMCSVETDVVQCVLDSLHALVGSVHCHSARGMESLLMVQVRAILQEYDNYCAPDCRQTLETKMKQCYKDLGLNPDLFLSTSSDGAILGNSPSSVTKFCNNSDALVTCLKKERDACAESPYVMKKLGLDLDTYSQGIDTLCAQKKVYLSSLDCFGEQTRSVEKCQEDHALTLMRMVSKVKAEAKVKAEVDVWGEEFLNKFCLARVQFIKCDLQAWAVKAEEACDAPALALKRDVHCLQIPRECRHVMSGPVREVCTYNWAAVSLLLSGDGSTGGVGSETSSLLVVLLSVAVLAAVMVMG